MTVQMLRLRDLGQWTGGNTPSKARPEFWTNGTVPWVSPKDMKRDEIAASEDRISLETVRSGRASLLDAGVMLVVTRSGILSHTLPVAITKVPVTINQDLKALTPKQGICVKYVALAVKSASQQILKRCSKHGTTVASVDTNALMDFTIPVVGLQQQHAVVAEIEKQFSRLDEAVANLRRIKANLRRYRAATLSDAFLGDQPSWARASYGEVGTVITGFTPSTADSSNFGGAVPFFKPTDLDAGDNVRVARQHLSQHGLSKGRRLKPGSVLVTCIGATIGKTGLAQVECATNQQINAVSPHEALIDARFLYWWTVSPAGQRQILESASATTLPIINKSKFSALAVPLPPLEDQRRIVAEVDRRLSITRGVEAQVDANLKRAQALRQAVLAKAFSATPATSAKEATT